MKHKITKNVFFIIYPLSILDNIPFIKNIEAKTFIKRYCSHIFNIFKPIGSFIIGIIISDWASSKLKK